MSHASAHHITPRNTLLKVFGALVVLTILTVVTSRIDLGVLNVPLALVIAGAKATLVVLIFMALKWDNRMNLLVLTVGILFVIVFLAFTLLDTNYRGDLSNTTKGTIQEQEATEQEMMERGSTSAPAAARDEH